MLPTAHLAAFVLAVWVLILVPGPSVLFAVSRGVALGRRAALATVLGNTLGLFVQLVFVSLGVGALIARSDAVFTTLKLVGAVYLVLLGVRTFRERRELAGLLGRPVERKPLSRIIREGFLVGATNPKGALIFTVIVPQFIVRSSGRVSLQIFTLGLVCCLLALVSDGTWGLAAGTARQLLSRSPRRLSWLGAGGGVTLVGLGLGLALTGRKD